MTGQHLLKIESIGIVDADGEEKRRIKDDP